MKTMLIIGMGDKSKKGPSHMNPMEMFLKGKGSKAEKGSSEPMVEDEAASTASGQVTFNQPAGFQMPDGVKDGESFDAMATLKMVDGRLVLAELDGTPVQDEAMEMSEEMEPMEPSQEEPADVEDDMAESEPKASDSDTYEEDEAEAEEPADFLSAVEKKSKKFKK